MARCKLIPTEKIRNEAIMKKEDPIKYMNKKPFFIPADARYDERKKDKFTYEYLQDILVIRDDNSKLIIHEIESDISTLKKVELSEVNQNDYVTEIIQAYTDGLDFSKMQSDKEYLDCLAYILLSSERIDSKKILAKDYGLKEIYIGTIKRDEKTGQYDKRNRKGLKLSDIVKIKKQLELEKKIKEEEKNENKNKFKMISAIYSQLETMSSEDLSKLCELLKIPIDDLDLDNSR